MPELPEVETIVRGLRKNIIGPSISEAKVYFAPIVGGKNRFFEKQLKGQKFTKISRHGKYIKLITNQGKNLLIHLRMTGQLFTALANHQVDKHTHVALTFQNGKKLIYRDVRKFGRWTIIPDNKDFSDYINAGPDALAITQIELKNLQQRYPKMKLKVFLLNQTIIAGIGNIYADEICYALKKHPEVLVEQIDTQKLYQIIQHILNLSIKHQGTTISDYRTSSRSKGNFQNLLKVYGQKKCQKCKSVVSKIKVAGRSTHFCSQCQKPC
ncbi:MAG: bifunctional DNA-formamidopyrimidine glycosylase/DNA-(apurinic or apyrimidinic site) lyase [Pseudomonadota bacterium]